MICDHDFKEVSKTKNIKTGDERIGYVCIYCGEVRGIDLTKGIIEIVKDKFRIIREQ